MSANRAERRRRQKADWNAAQRQLKGGGGGDCGGGHPDQARAFMLYGIAPTKCERCGETPVFGPVERGGFDE